MATLSDVYEKFGEVAEAAQLLETELGTMLLTHACLDADLIENPNSEKATDIYEKINKHTLGRLVAVLNKKDKAPAVPDLVLEKAIEARNFLSHSFYRHHNFRRNSSEGCQIMLNDLQRLHEEILQAYSALMSASGFDIVGQGMSGGNHELPTKWVKL